MMKTAMQQLLDKLSECIKAGQDIEKLIPMLSNQYLEIERQQLEKSFIKGGAVEQVNLLNENFSADRQKQFDNYFKTTYNEK